VVAVQLGEQHRLDLEGVDLLLAQRGQAGRSAVQQHARCVDLVSSQGDAGLEPATGAKRIPAAHRHHTHDPIIPRAGSGKAGSWPIRDPLSGRSREVVVASGAVGPRHSCGGGTVAAEAGGAQQGGGYASGALHPARLGRQDRVGSAVLDIAPCERRVVRAVDGDGVGEQVVGEHTGPGQPVGSVLAW